MDLGAFILAAQFPGQGHTEVLDRAVATALATERAGLDDVWLAEHHFVPYGTCPSAVTLAAYLLGRTERVKVGTAVSVLPNAHPVALGEQAALLHLTSNGRFRLGVGRGGPWVDLEVFGGGLEAFESGFPESLDLLLRWLSEPSVGTAGPRYSFREVTVVPRAAGDGGSAGGGPSGDGPADGPEVLVACTSPGSVGLAARRGLPMILGMHCDDQEKARLVAHYRRTALAAGRDPAEVDAVGHVSAGLAQVADTDRDATDLLLKCLPEMFRHGLAAHVTVDGSTRAQRDPHAYTELLCRLHPVGSPGRCAERIAATAEATGIRRFAFLVEGSGDREATTENLARLGAEVRPLVA